MLHSANIIKGILITWQKNKDILGGNINLTDKNELREQIYCQNN